MALSNAAFAVVSPRILEGLSMLTLKTPMTSTSGVICSRVVVDLVVAVLLVVAVVVVFTAVVVVVRFAVSVTLVVVVVVVLVVFVLVVEVVVLVFVVVVVIVVVVAVGVVVVVVLSSSMFALVALASIKLNVMFSSDKFAIDEIVVVVVV
mmetsp:Transcript_28716/g.51137  ORF Transcript_28716/g.51137 Transcript_28716/m.51137 type:complete len:150 (-) Transcript_28716:377-826(-)